MSQSSAPHHPAPTQSQLLLVWGSIVVALLILGGMIIFRQMSEPATGGEVAPAGEIGVAEAATRREAGAFILDVRQPEEWADAHIPDSTLIPLDQLATRVNEIPRDREVIVICRVGNRSKMGRDILLQAGFTNVTSMAGGLRDWQTQGLPTVRGP